MHAKLPIFSLVLLLASQLLVACGPSTVNQLTNKTNAKQFTAEEILILAKDNTLFIHGDNIDSYFYFDESGHTYAQDTFNNKDTGRWDVSDQDELCFKMSSWWFGKLRCFTVYNDSTKYYLFNNSEVLDFTADFLKGDSKNLYRTMKKKSKRSFLGAQNREKAFQQAESPSTTVDETEVSENYITSGGPTDEELKSTVKWIARDCPGCNLANTNLSGANLVGANLQDANLSGADLSKANLRRANLKGANLENADLSYANMPGADLRESALNDAVLKGANLIRANFTGADTKGANFLGAILESTEGLQQY